MASSTSQPATDQSEVDAVGKRSKESSPVVHPGQLERLRARFGERIDALGRAPRAQHLRPLEARNRQPVSPRPSWVLGHRRTRQQIGGRKGLKR